MKLTIASYNIMHGGLSGYDMKKLVESIVECGADLIGVQEVDIGAKRSGGRDIAAMMAAELGYEVRFSRSLDFQGGSYGNVILSRYPIVDFTAHMLVSGKYEQRSIGCATVQIGDEKISFWNTHLSFENTEQRRLQLEQIRELVPKDMPWILTGDFNTSNFDEMRILGDVSMVNDFDHIHKTFRESGSPIDNIIYTAPWSVIRAGIVDNDHSDHNLLYAVMEK
jgi:endonuclease/exonuclease/phosphatase family metal-dependent hydrolase